MLCCYAVNHEAILLVKLFRFILLLQNLLQQFTALCAYSVQCMEIVHVNFSIVLMYAYKLLFCFCYNSLQNDSKGFKHDPRNATPFDSQDQAPPVSTSTTD